MGIVDQNVKRSWERWTYFIPIFIETPICTNKSVVEFYSESNIMRYGILELERSYQGDSISRKAGLRYFLIHRRSEKMNKFASWRLFWLLSFNHWLIFSAHRLVKRKVDRWNRRLSQIPELHMLIYVMLLTWYAGTDTWPYFRRRLWKLSPN